MAIFRGARHRPITELRAHFAMVRLAAARLRDGGAARVFADVPGERAPATLAGLGEYPDARPDASGRLAKNRLVLVEVETCGSLADAHVAAEWGLFRARATMVKGLFVVAVPERCGEARGEDLARETAGRLGIAPDEIWTFPVDEAT